MKMRIPIFATFALLTLAPMRAETYAQKLGWAADDIVLILHVDDAGMSHASNRGAIESTQNGVATSFSIMMPCPWVPEIAAFAREHPSVDSGLHLTLTSEWRLYRWGPLAGKPAVPGLVDPQGCLWHSVEQVASNASPAEIETEIRAQIERAENLGLEITHLDSHMGTLFARADYFERFMKVGIEKRLPILAIGGHMTHTRQEHPETSQALRPLAEKIWAAGLPVIDDLHTQVTSWSPDVKKARFIKLVEEMQPGITEILFHASIPTDDFPLVTGTSASRHADTKLLTDPEIKQLFERRKIKLTTWRELKQRRAKLP